MAEDYPKRSPIRLAALLALLAMCGPFTIDAFFPAFSAVAKDLRANDWDMQLTISVYLWANALMSLFHGPLSDAYGRRRVILWGVFLFMAASIGCAFCRTIEQLWFFRALQGISTGAGLIVSRAIVRDLYQGPAAQKVMALISMFFSVAPAVAPIIGGLVFQWGNWHAVFWLLAAYGAGLWLFCLRVLPETHPPALRVSFSAKHLFDIYSRILRDGRFLLLVLCAGFNFCAFFLYISSAPAFVEKILHLGPMGYPWFFVPAIMGMTIGAAIANVLAGKVPARFTTHLAYLVMWLAVFGNLAYVYLTKTLTLPWAVFPVALICLGLSITFPVLSLAMLDRYPHHRGAASSMQAFVWGVMTGWVAAQISPLFSHDAKSLAWAACGFIALGFCCWLIYSAITPLPADRKEEEILPDPVER